MNSVYSFIRHQPSIYAFGVAFILMAISSNVFGDEPAHVETWKITEGSLILTTQGQMPDEHDLLLSTRSSEGHRRDQSSTVTLQVTADSTLDVEVIGQAYKLIGGDIHFDQPLQLKTKWLTRDLHRLLLNTNPNDRSIEFVLTDQTNENDEGIVFQTSNVRFDPERRSLIVDTDTIGLTHGLARKINDHSRDRNTIGSAVLRVSLERYVDGELIAVTNTSDTQTFDSSVAGVIGPDIIAASIPQINRYGGNYNAICEDCFEFPLPGDLADCDTATPAPCKTAFMMGTTSCNLGDQRAKWIQHTNEHPVIGQNMYRLYSNRLEQIGMAWVKHGFFALSDDYCGECLDSPGLECTDTRQPCSFDTDCNPGADCFDFTGMELGVGCSDPYSASLNSIQGGLGPRYHINAFTGDFVFPQSRPPFLPEDSFARRLQVFNDDLDPALNVGAQYFIEAQYITADDALAGNGTNNVSFRPVSIINTNVEMYMPSVTGTTRTETAAIQAWRENDSSVVETDVLIPGEGKFILAAKAWELNNGLWRYEYALQNINSDRSAGSFSVALPVGHALSNIGFHDIDYHSGEIFDPTDWFPTVLVESIVWATTPYVFDENANALRWGTLYNFRFDCNVAPQPASVTIGLFKPGSPQEVEVASIGPSIGLIDCNNNGTADVCDLNCDVPGCVQPCGTAIDCNNNSIPDDCEADCNNNQVADSCDISNETSTDCNINLIPDDCDIASEASEDCNLNDLPDECEILPDTDQDGIKDCYDACPSDGGPVNACICPDVDLCCFPSSLCIPNFSRSECLILGGAPNCQFSPCRSGCVLSDFDGDGDVDLRDSMSFIHCFSGSIGQSEYVEPSAECLLRYDYDLDMDVDHSDFFEHTQNLSGPMLP